MTPEDRAQAFLDTFDVKGYAPQYVTMLASMIREAEAAEREACAKIADDYAKESWGLTEEEAAATNVAELIRARAPQADTPDAP